MLTRWVAITFALVPVVFIPTCAATRAVLFWRAPTPVNRAVTTQFPVLQIGGLLGARTVEIVPFASAFRDKNAWLSVPLAEWAKAVSLVVAMPSTRMADEDRHMRAEVDCEDHGPRLQRVHVAVLREVASSESWYDTDGKSLIPRYERQYDPVLMLVGACAIAVPASVGIAGACAPLLLSFRRREGLRAPPPAFTRVVLATGLYLVGALWFVGPRLPVAIGLLIVVAGASLLSVIPWTRRSGRVTAAALVAAMIGLIALGDIGVAVLFGRWGSSFSSRSPW